MNEIIDNYNVNAEIEIDNSELEDIMLIEPGMMTIADEEEFFRLLKEAKLFIPIHWEKEEVFNIEDQSVVDVIKPVPPLGFNFIISSHLVSRTMKERLLHSQERK